MNIITKILLLLSATLLLINGIYAKFNSEHQIITIGVYADSYWDVPSGNPNELLEEAIKEFQAEHPNVEVKYVSGIPKNTYSEWLAEKLLAGEEPDLFLVDDEELHDYASIGALLNLNNFIEEDSTFSVDDYYPAAMKPVMHDKDYYALPLESVPTLMFVNKTLLAQQNLPLPANNWSWKDFHDICQKVTKDTNGDGRPDSYGCYAYSWQQAAISNNVELFKDNGRISSFGDKNLEDAIRYLMELKEINNGYEIHHKDFDLGKVAFRPFTFAEYRTYQPYPWRIKKYGTFEWDVVKFPAGPYGKNISPTSTTIMSISSRTKHPKLAWEFLKKLSYDKNIQIQILSKSQGLPVRRDILNTPEAQELFDKSMGEGSDHMTLATIDSIMSEAIAETHFKNYSEVMLKADTTIQKIIDGQLPINNTLNKLQKEINTYLQE